MAAKKPQSSRKTKPTDRPDSSPRLAGKVAVITGGSSGIGYAIARTLAGEGCSVVIAGRNDKKLAQAAASISTAKDGSGGVVPQVCDVRDPHAVDALFSMVKRRFKHLDVLVNNAGITQPVVSVENTSIELWRDVIDRNLTAVFLCTKAALPLMKRDATIINNLSAAAKQVFPNYATYSAAKRGALGFTLSLRQELIPRGIRVVALMPGATYTPMWEEYMPNPPRERMMAADTIAQTVLYAVLLPPEANVSELLLDPTAGPL
jgi:NAD(P)-dependent dehydrogenase (short-subunit alcohol dehydrogenase family)